MALLLEDDDELELSLASEPLLSLDEELGLTAMLASLELARLVLEALDAVPVKLASGQVRLFRK